MNIPEMKSLCYQMYDNARDVCCDKTKQVLLHKEYYEKGLEHPSKAMLILQDAETKRSNKYKKIAILKKKMYLQISLLDVHIEIGKNKF